MILKKHASLFLISVTIALLFVFLVFSSSASNSAKNGIYLCINTVIPTLFPILVINGLLISSGAAYRITRILARPIKKIYGIDENGVYPTLIGLICGAPSGCIALSSMLEGNYINREEASMLAVNSSPMSFSFLYATVGIRMLGSIQLGVLLFFINVISAVIAGRILQAITVKKMKDCHHAPSLLHQNYHMSFSMSQAISDAASKLISICGAIVFFSSLSGIVISMSKIPFFVRAITAMFLEVTSGAQIICDSMPTNAAFLYLCAGCGWSGASIICQCLSSIHKKASLGLFLIGKCLCSLICLVIGTMINAIGII